VLLNAVSIASMSTAPGLAQVPSTWPGGTVLVTLHAEGAQIYGCKTELNEKSLSQGRALTWQFREPIATLVADGKSNERHYAAPSWDYIDGSGVKGKVAVGAPGATPGDIPWLQLDVSERRGEGILSKATIVRRINTKGGVAQGSCESARALPERALFGGLGVFAQK